MTRAVDALRALLVSSSSTWGWMREAIGGLWARTGRRYLVFAGDGPREVARQRTASGIPPTAPQAPPPQAPPRCHLRTRLQGPATRGSRQDPNDRAADAYPPMVGHRWRQGQRRLSR